MSFIKAILARVSGRKTANYFEENGIRFFHHNPPRGNIGDYLCSPRHYFDFDPAISGLNIVGGGVYVDMGVRFINKHGLDPAKTILWGVGESIREATHPGPVADLPFLEWSCRDRDRVGDDTHFVPCCSCLHKMLDAPVPADNTLLFVNADPKVSGVDDSADLASEASRRGWTLLFNNCSESEFSEALKQSKYVVTNSYHGAYWGLLSGRTVSLVGYSSKFYSLFSAFELPADRIVRYDRGDEQGLSETLSRLDIQTSGVRVALPDQTREAFRQRNRDFADRLVRKGILAGYRFSERVL